MASRKLGFTLLESLVALILTSVVLVAAGGLSITLARTARDTEVNLKVQRDLVFVIDAIQPHLRVATSWEELATAQPPVNVGEFVKGYSIKGLQYQPASGYTFDKLTDIQLTSDNRLYVGSRLVSSLIDDIELRLSASSSHVAEVYVKSVDQVPFVSPQHLPISLTLDVAMRNSPIAGPHSETLALISGPAATKIVAQQSTITWTCNVVHRATIRYTGPSVNETVDVPLYRESHSVTLSGLTKNNYTYYLELKDRYGRELLPNPSGTITK